jgi:hypothetical protein
MWLVELGLNIHQGMIRVKSITESRNLISSCKSSCLAIADSSLAKTAMLFVLSKKASRMKGVVDLLKRDLMGGRNRAKEGQFETIIARGRAAVEGAKY